MSSYQEVALSTSLSAWANSPDDAQNNTTVIMSEDFKQGFRFSQSRIRSSNAAERAVEDLQVDNRPQNLMMYNKYKTKQNAKKQKNTTHNNIPKGPDSDRRSSNQILIQTTSASLCENRLMMMMMPIMVT